MKRKQAKTHNPRGTYQFLTAEDLNAIRTGGFARPVSLNNGVDIYCATDYSYQRFGNSFSRRFRKDFQVFTWDMISDDELSNEIFKIGSLDANGRGSVSRPVYYFFGARIVVEYFDENAIIDFTNMLDDDRDMEYSYNRFVSLFSGRFNVQQINEHLINVSLN